MRKNNEPLTAVWQNGGFSAKLNGSSSFELLCKTEHLCFDFRHFAKLQNVICKQKKNIPKIMEIGKLFNTLTFEEYYFYIDNHKKYSDFNTLGLYRSLVENENLSLEQKISLREYANKIFQKTFDFLQIKDPWTYAKVISLGFEMTNGDNEDLWCRIRDYQIKTLSDKRIRHQNFGVYSKHNCGYETCPLNGLMIKQGSFFAEYEMCLGYQNKYSKKVKSEKRKSERKNQTKIIKKEIDAEN